MPTKVLMVCLGNICRSPLALGIMRQLTQGKAFEIDSAGTANYHAGAPPDPRSIEVAAQNGIDISQQQARQLTHQDLDDFDHILVMDKQNLQDALALCTSKEQRQKIFLLNDVSGISPDEVPDPYYGSEDGFVYVYTLLYHSCRKWLEAHH